MWSKIVFLFYFVSQIHADFPTEANKDFFLNHIIRAPGHTDTSEASAYEEFESVSPISQCKLLPVGVKTPNSTDPRYVHWPSHVTINRCFGGCSLTKHSCVSKSRDIEITLSVLKPVGNAYQVERLEKVTMKEDFSCDCNCAQQATDCTSEQFYESSFCKCTCNNQKTCEENKKMNKYNCKCECANVVACPEGQVFSKKACSCVTDTGLGESGMSLQELCPTTMCPPPQKISIDPNACTCSF